jgi:hypothetical protein
MNTLETEKVLKAFADKVVNRAVNNLAKQDHITSGNLARNLDYDLKVYPSGALELDFTAPFYWKFQDKGVKGSSGLQSPKGKRNGYNSPFKFKGKNIARGVALDFIKKKGIQGRDDKGRFIKHKTLAYLIGRSIALYGIPATRFFSTAFRYEAKRLPPEIRKAYANDIDKFLKFAIKDYNKKYN